MIGRWTYALGWLVVLYFILYSCLVLMFEVLAWLRNWSLSYPELQECFTL